MAEVLVIGKKISEMGLVNEITGEEKIPTSASGDKAVTTGQLLTYVNNNGVAQWGRIGGDITNQVDLQNQFTQQLATLQNHIQDQGNPHNVTKEQVGLGLVDNTADMDKPVSVAVQEALSLKADQTYVDDSLVNKTHNSLLGRDAGGAHPASAISDGSGKTQQEINSNTAYFYHTVAAMVADESLTDGRVVATKGYHNISDSGGATYLISSVATDYSIPLSNGLHAVFRDTFDIRKFGIVSSKTLDQTENIRRMIAYADSREYEIDFHNFFIMTPDIVQYTSSRGTILKGMGFNYPHKIKNVKPVNNKTIPIYQGTTPIQFLPKQKGNGEIFELENVRFDLYVADQIFISGEGDGRFNGFYAGWHPDYPVSWPDTMRSECGYKFKANGIYVDTPAVTSTLALNLWFSDIEFKNMFGDFIGYYTTHFGTRVTAENCHGVYRDDLHAEGRLLVTNFFQEEQEVGSGGFAYNQEYQRFKNISCLKHTDGSAYVAIKRHVMQIPTLGKFEAEDVVGNIDWDAAGQDLLINEIDISKANSRVRINCSFEKATLRDLTVGVYLFTNPNATFGDIILDNVVVDYSIAYGVSLNKLELINGCKVNAPVVAANVQLTNLVAKDLKSFVYQILVGDIQSIYLDGWHHTPSGTFASPCINTSAVSAKMTIINSNIQDPQTLSTSNRFIRASNTDANTKLDLSVINTYMTRKPSLQLGLGTLTWVNSSPALPVEVTYNPPSLAAAGAEGDSTTTTVTLNGAVVGDNVSAAFSLYNSGIRIYPVVSAANTVTVEFRNISAAPIDLGSGTLAVKLI